MFVRDRGARPCGTLVLSPRGHRRGVHDPRRRTPGDGSVRNFASDLPAAFPKTAIPAGWSSRRRRIPPKPNPCRKRNVRGKYVRTLTELKPWPTSRKPSSPPLSPLQQMSALGADWWNDSLHLRELGEAVARGAVGATSNPVIVSTAVSEDRARWVPVLDASFAGIPSETEDRSPGGSFAQIGREAAALLRRCTTGPKEKRVFSRCRSARSTIPTATGCWSRGWSCLPRSQHRDQGSRHRGGIAAMEELTPAASA